jgi:hypothetical protein
MNTAIDQGTWRPSMRSSLVRVRLSIAQLSHRGLFCLWNCTLDCHLCVLAFVSLAAATARRAGAFALREAVPVSHGRNRTDGGLNPCTDPMAAIHLRSSMKLNVLIHCSAAVFTIFIHVKYTTYVFGREYGCGPEGQTSKSAGGSAKAHPQRCSRTDQRRWI